MQKKYLVFAEKRYAAMQVAARQHLPFEECILIDDEEHAKDLIKNSTDLIRIHLNTKLNL